MWVDRDPRGAGLSNSTARPMTLICCEFKKVFLVNHGRDILNCSSKCSCVSNPCRN